jgi:hypothetical protein
MPRNNTDPRVDVYIEALPEWQQAICHSNKTARTVAIRKGERINAPALTTMLKHIIANNRAGLEKAEG